MRSFEVLPQTAALFPRCSDCWSFLEPADFGLIHLPNVLSDHVFRVAFARLPFVHFFEVLVSDQFPKDSYASVLRPLRDVGTEAMVVSVVHPRSAGSHAVFWRKECFDVFHHLDVDFSHLSELDRLVLEVLSEPRINELGRLFEVLEGRDFGSDFYRVLRRLLERVPREQESQHLAVVDLLLKIVFLIFVQRKGWLNMDPFYIENKMAACRQARRSILNCFLRPLFAALEGFPVAAPIDLGRLPRLSGGLFSFCPHALPSIENDWFLEVYRVLTSKFSFSLFESERERRTSGIGPEVLGFVFENLIFKGSRKREGIFFTPPAMARQQVEAVFEGWEADCLEGLSDEARLSALSQVRVFDPGCGSGTYLVAAFRRLLRLRLDLVPRCERFNGRLFELKREIATRNLFGLDISPMAVRLTEVRLWLNMIQDVEVDEPELAPSLPSLQHHLRCGDFLGRYIPRFCPDIRKWSKYAMLERLRERFPDAAAVRRKGLLKHIHRLESECLQWLASKVNEGELAILRERHSQGVLPGMDSDDFQALVGARLRRDVDAAGLHVLFSDAFLEGGFDLVLGNPPWLGAAERKGPGLSRLKPLLPPFLSLKGQVDLSLYFLAFALNLLKVGGYLTFLLPSKILQARFAEGIRRYMKDRLTLAFIHDFGADKHQLFRADTFPLAIGLANRPARPGHLVSVERLSEGRSEIFATAQDRLGEGHGLWVLRPEEDLERFREAESWPRLRDLPESIHRGVVTGNKRVYVFDEVPDVLGEAFVRPLLRGRDIQAGAAAPGSFIFWPWDVGGRVLPLNPDQIAFLRAAGLPVLNGHRFTPAYQHRKLGPFTIVWKYLARHWTPVLLSGSQWVPDQTTYYMSFSGFPKAFSFFRFFCSGFADDYLKLVAEPGKDDHRFFYAHTCGLLPIPVSRLLEDELALTREDRFSVEAETAFPRVMTSADLVRFERVGAWELVEGC